MCRIRGNIYFINSGIQVFIRNRCLYKFVFYSTLHRLWSMRKYHVLQVNENLMEHRNIHRFVCSERNFYSFLFIIFYVKRIEWFKRYRWNYHKRFVYFSFYRIGKFVFYWLTKNEMLSLNINRQTSFKCGIYIRLTDLLLIFYIIITFFHFIFQPIRLCNGF